MVIGLPLEKRQTSGNGVGGQSFEGVAISMPGGEARADNTSPHLATAAGSCHGVSGVIKTIGLCATAQDEASGERLFIGAGVPVAGLRV